GMMGNLALTYKHLGQYAKAESLFGEAIAILEKQPGAIEVRATEEDNLGTLYMRENKLEAGGKHLLIARELFKKTPNSASAAMNLDNLSSYYRAIGKIP